MRYLYLWGPEVVVPKSRPERARLRAEQSGLSSLLADRASAAGPAGSGAREAAHRDVSRLPLDGGA